MAHTHVQFPTPDHDHTRCSAGALDHAERVLAGHGQNFTPIRRAVLNALLASHRPLGAYDLIGALAEMDVKAAPITIYRTLDFLMQNGLVHRIESRNAFLACAHAHQSGTHVALLICERCNVVGEADAPQLGDSLAAVARGADFTPRLSVIEISGVCARCRDAA